MCQILCSTVVARVALSCQNRSLDLKGWGMICNVQTLRKPYKFLVRFFEYLRLLSMRSSFSPVLSGLISICRPLTAITWHVSAPRHLPVCVFILNPIRDKKLDQAMDLQQQLFALQIRKKDSICIVLCWLVRLPIEHQSRSSRDVSLTSIAQTNCSLLLELFVIVWGAPRSFSLTIDQLSIRLRISRLRGCR